MTLTPEERIEQWKKEREKQSPKSPANIWEVWGLSAPVNPAPYSQTGGRPKKKKATAKKSKKGSAK